MKLGSYFLSAAVVGGLACAVSASEDTLGTLYRINGETEAKIQAQVLDSLLGPGKAFVFLEMTAEVRKTAEKASKSGIGQTHKKSSKLEEENSGDGKEEGKKPSKEKNQAATQEQSASQEKSSAEKSEVFTFTAGSMKARILHDAALAPDRLKAVKEALPALYPGKIKSEDIVLVPAAFAPAAGKAEAGAR